jgi:hypothetical protein
VPKSDIFDPPKSSRKTGKNDEKNTKKHAFFKNTPFLSVFLPKGSHAKTEIFFRVFRKNDQKTPFFDPFFDPFLTPLFDPLFDPFLDPGVLGPRKSRTSGAEKGSCGVGGKPSAGQGY